jgi:transposase-like protein
VKVQGKWAYLYVAVDKDGNTIDFYLSATRNTTAAKRFLGKALRGLKDWEKPSMITTDKAPTYAAALAELKRGGQVPGGDAAPAGQLPEQRHRGRPRQAGAADPAGPRLQDAQTAYATIKGFEVMRALRKGAGRDLQPDA